MKKSNRRVDLFYTLFIMRNFSFFCVVYPDDFSFYYKPFLSVVFDFYTFIFSAISIDCEIILDAFSTRKSMSLGATTRLDKFSCFML